MLDRACGVDVHRDNFTATVLTSKDCETKKLEKDLEGIEAFKAWLRESKCKGW